MSINLYPEIPKNDVLNNSNIVEYSITNEDYDKIIKTIIKRMNQENFHNDITWFFLKCCFCCHKIKSVTLEEIHEWGIRYDETNKIYIWNKFKFEQRFYKILKQ